MPSFYILAQEINGNVCQDAALHSPIIGPVPQPSAVPNPGFVPSNPATPRVSPNVTPYHTDDESDTDHSNRPLKKARQKSHNSHIGKGQYILSVILLMYNVITSTHVHFLNS